MPSCPSTLLLIVFVLTSAQTDGDDPICSLAPLPFENATAVYNWKLQEIEMCWYEYWRCENIAKYRGARGFKTVHGDDGYMYNRSSVAVYDGKPMKGHGPISAKARFAKNLACINEEFDASRIDLNITDWGPYSVVYSWKMRVIFTMPAFEGSQLTVSILSNYTYFEDASGIIERVEKSSSGGMFGAVLSNIMDTTQSIAELLGIDDIDIDPESEPFLYTLFGENMNPTVMVFLLVISVFTACIASVVCIILVFIRRKAYHGWVPVKMTDIDSSDSQT